MQSVVCSRPFVSHAQHRAAAQHASAGKAAGAYHFRQVRQRPQQQAVLLSSSASSAIRGCSCSSFAGAAMPASPLLERQTSTDSPRRQVTRMGNKGDKGPFAPAVRIARDVVGKKQFNKLRGKAISLHSQVIKDFTTRYLGASTQQAQGLIRTAKKNGEKLGFLA